MEIKIQNNIVQDILFIDSNFISNRIGCIERTTDWSSDTYIQCRKALFDKKINNKKFILRDIGDRRDGYIQKKISIIR